MVQVLHVWGVRISKEQMDDVKTPDEGKGSQVRPPKVQGSGKCAPCEQKQQRRGAVAVQPAQAAREYADIKLSEREMTIYQAGQRFGSAEAFRHASKYLTSMATKLSEQSAAQQAAGHELLDRLTIEPTKTTIADRLSRAIRVLVGDE